MHQILFVCLPIRLYGRGRNPINYPMRKPSCSTCY